MISDKPDKAVKQKAEHAISEQNFSQPNAHIFRRRKASKESHPLWLMQQPNTCWKTTSKTIPMKKTQKPNADEFWRKHEI